VLVSDKALAGREVQAALAAKHLTLLRPSLKDEPDLDSFPAWLRQRVETIVWTLKHQLGLDRHGGIPSGLWARVVQRLLALNAVICGTGDRCHAKRSRITYDH
jgi:hypothetical protein